jgi:hypothetical protein
MLSILSAILGFAGPFVPELIKFFRQKQDNAHELAVLQFQAQIAAQEHAYRMEAINISADIQESAIIHQPQISFGVQILDAAKDWSKVFVLPVFYLFAFLDFISGLVRPAVTYAIVAFYLMYKYALFEMARIQSADWKNAATMVWNADDLSLLLLTLGWYFGNRAVKATFGGSANTGRPGA